MSVIALTLLLTSLLTLVFNTRKAEATIRRVPEDYPTIQQAVNAAENGDIVLVSNGTYYENVVIYGKSISVIGKDTSNTFIKGVSEVG